MYGFNIYLSFQKSNGNNLLMFDCAKSKKSRSQWCLRSAVSFSGAEDTNFLFFTCACISISREIGKWNYKKICHSLYTILNEINNVSIIIFYYNDIIN